jgi:DNA-binding NarL/FixJ family response regulator
MPHLDGLGEWKSLACYGQKPRVIILTSFGTGNMTQRAVQLGSRLLYSKTNSIWILSKRIRQLVSILKMRLLLNCLTKSVINYNELMISGSAKLPRWRK